MISELPNGFEGLSLSPLAKLAHFDTTKGEQYHSGLETVQDEVWNEYLNTPYKEGLARAAAFVHFGD